MVIAFGPTTLEMFPSSLTETSFKAKKYYGDISKKHSNNKGTATVQSYFEPLTTEQATISKTFHTIVGSIAIHDIIQIFNNTLLQCN